jgi:hypothetical protein
MTEFAKNLFFFPGERYLLSWDKNPLGNGKSYPQDIVIFEGEFIKYFDASFLEEAKTYFSPRFIIEGEGSEEHERVVKSQLYGENGRPKRLAFEDPQYPFLNTNMFMDKNGLPSLTKRQLKELTPQSIGLFKYINCIRYRNGSMHKDIQNIDGSEQLTIHFKNNKLHNADNEKGIYIPNQTMFWVNVNEVNHEMNDNVYKKFLQDFEAQQVLPRDVIFNEIGEYIGVPQKKTTARPTTTPRPTTTATTTTTTGGKRFNKSKSKTRKNKTKKSRK